MGSCPACALRGALNQTVKVLEEVVTAKPGDQIGRYKLFEQIGEGGCGSVFMAEQSEPIRRQVALKVVKLGLEEFKRLVLEERARLAHDVNFIAIHTAYKEQLLAGMVRELPGLDLRIWGDQWRERCTSEELRPFLAGQAIFGSTYCKAICASKINLAITSGVVEGASSGDLTTTRSYEIPACGGFMLHQRNHEVLELYKEGSEIACFESGEEMAEKIRHYLAHPEEREAVAEAGHRRCVPAYSYDARMAELLRYC